MARDYVAIASFHIVHGECLREVVEAARDALEALRDAYEGNDFAVDCEMNRRINALNGEIEWLRAEYDHIDDVLPFERPDYSWAR